MELDERYKVKTRASQQEHAVAAPEKTRALLDAIGDGVGTCQELAGHHFMSLDQLQARHLVQLFRCAAMLESGARNKCTLLTGRILASTFIDDVNARAQQSFDNAFMRLGGAVMRFGHRLDAPEDDPGALTELATMFNNYADVAVVRAQYADSVYRMLDDSRVPIINAGNGLEEHPTHALADLYTLFKWRPDLLDPTVPKEQGLNIAILSTPAQSRNVSSLLLGLTRFPHAVRRVVVFGRSARNFREGQLDMLRQAGLTIETDLELYPDRSLIGGVKDALPEMDVVYSDRTRKWNMSRQDTLQGMSVIEPGAMVLHPQLREVTVSEHLDHSEHNGYFAQERHSVFMRMAVFLSVLGIDW